MTDELRSLDGKLVLVTGASRGIGRAVAVAAAGAGAELLITGRTIGALEEVDDEIKAAGGTATIVEMDMKDTAAIPRLAAAIMKRWGRLDGLVANAGMLPALTPVAHLQPDVWDECLAVNLSGQWHLIKGDGPSAASCPCRACNSGVVWRGGWKQTFLGALRRSKSRAGSACQIVGRRERANQSADQHSQSG